MLCVVCVIILLFILGNTWLPHGRAWSLEKKVLALKVKVDEVKRRAESRGEEPPDLSKRAKAAEPIASFSAEGELKWNEGVVKRLKELSAQKTKRWALNPMGVALQMPGCGKTMS